MCLLHDLPQECIFWSRSSHLNTVLPPSLERFLSACFNQFACQEEAKASAQSLQETLAAKKEAGNTKEWGVSSDLSSRVVVDGWYDIGPIPSREKGIDSRRVEWESLSTRSSPRKFFLQVEEEKERAEAAAAEAEETCSTVVSWTVFHTETIFCDSAQLKQFCHSSLPRNCEKGPKSLNTDIDFQEKLKAAQDEADGVRGTLPLCYQVFDAGPVAGKSWKVWCIDTLVLGCGKLQWSISISHSLSHSCVRGGGCIESKRRQQFLSVSLWAKYNLDCLCHCRS